MKAIVAMRSVLPIAISAISAVVSAAPNKECSEGKTAITIVNPAGKVIELCVPDAVADSGVIGGPSDVVIPATCPAFSQEDVEAALNAAPDISCSSTDGSTTMTYDPCTYAVCQTDSEEIFAAIEGPADWETTGLCNFVGHGTAKNNNVALNGVTGFFSTELSESEADACVAILNTFVP